MMLTMSLKEMEGEGLCVAGTWPFWSQKNGLRGWVVWKFRGTTGRSADGGGQQRAHTMRAEYFQENRIWMSSPASWEMWEPQTLIVMQAFRLQLIGN